MFTGKISAKTHYMWCIGLFCLLSPLISHAQTLTVAPASPDLQDRLSAEASVLDIALDAPVGDVIATAQGDYGRLLALLYQEGYFGAEISIQLAGREAARLTALDRPSVVRPVVIEVSLGPAFVFGETEVAPLPPNADLPAGFVRGAPARTDVIRQTAATGISDWRDASHAKAELVDQKIVARHAQSALDVNLRIDPGPALRFGALVVPEDSGVRPNRLRAIAGLPANTPFSPAELDNVRDRLVDTGAFSSVIVREEEVPNPDGTLDIALEVQDAPLRRIGFGAEVETRDGISLEAFWMHRNAFGGAERLRFDFDVDGIGGETGGIDVALGGRLTIPGFRRPDSTLEIYGTLERLNEIHFTSQYAEIGVRRVRELRDSALEIGIGARLRYSDAEDAFGDRQFRHALLQIDATRDLRDDPLDARAGRYNQIKAEPFFGLSDGSGSGVRVTGDFRRYREVGERTVLAGRLHFGSILGSSLEETPPELLFFSGGGGTVRGQSFQSLGVDIPQGTVGGRGFVGANFEVRRDVTDTIGIVGFLDVGYVSEDGSFEDGESHAGVGLGVRYRTSLGPIRADIGIPLGGDSDDNFGLFIGIGQAF